MYLKKCPYIHYGICIMSYCILHPIIKIACNLFTKVLIETWSHLCVKSMKPFLSCISVHWCTLLLYETLCTSRSSLKLDPDLTQTLSLTFTFPKWSEVFEDGAMKSKVCSFFFLLCKERGSFSLYCLWHLSALVWAWSRACLVSLPSSIPFPDFLCMLRLTADVCERLSAARFCSHWICSL